MQIRLAIPQGKSSQACCAHLAARARSWRLLSPDISVLQCAPLCLSSRAWWAPLRASPVSVRRSEPVRSQRNPHSRPPLARPAAFRRRAAGMCSWQGRPLPPCRSWARLSRPWLAAVPPRARRPASHVPSFGTTTGPEPKSNPNPNHDPNPNPHPHPNTDTNTNHHRSPSPSP